MKILRKILWVFAVINISASVMISVIAFIDDEFSFVHSIMNSDILLILFLVLLYYTIFIMTPTTIVGIALAIFSVIKS